MAMTNTPATLTRLAILDDYQGVALRLGPWDRLPPGLKVEVFRKHLGGPDAVVAALAPFDAILAMRERTPFPKAVIDRLPNLRLLMTTGARNRSIDEIRRMHPKARLSALATSRHLFERGAIPLDKKSTPAGQAMKADRAQRVQMTIESMDEPLREVVILYFFQGLSREEVAEAVGLSLAGVKARLSKATRELREHLKSFDDSSL